MNTNSQNSKVLALAQEARASLSEYCMKECEAYCCRKGILVLNTKQKDLLVKDSEEELVNSGALTETKDGLFALDMGIHSCPRLDGTNCSVHKHPDRPKTCSEFPVFVRENTVHFSSRCPAVIAGKLYVYEKRFLGLGWSKE